MDGSMPSSPASRNSDSGVPAMAQEAPYCILGRGGGRREVDPPGPGLRTLLILSCVSSLLAHTTPLCVSGRSHSTGRRARLRPTPAQPPCFPEGKKFSFLPLSYLRPPHLSGRECGGPNWAGTFRSTCSRVRGISSCGVSPHLSLCCQPGPHRAFRQAV